MPEQDECRRVMILQHIGKAWRESQDESTQAVPSRHKSIGGETLGEAGEATSHCCLKYLSLISGFESRESL